MAAKLRFSCVAALEPARGIGKDGTLPWRLRGDMKFFAKLTSEVKTEGKQNAVIMGRKTWDSIPTKFRPLPKRLNIVLSKSLSTAPDGADHLCSSLESAIEVLSKQPLSDGIEQIFIIGGGSVYKEAMEHPSCHRLYLTHVMKDFDCDAFFPNFDQSIFAPISIPEVAGEIQEEKGIQYKFKVYERQNSNHSNGTCDKRKSGYSKQQV